MTRCEQKKNEMIPAAAGELAGLMMVLVGILKFVSAR